MQGHQLRGYCNKWAINHRTWVIGVAVVGTSSTLNIEPLSFANGLDVE